MGTQRWGVYFSVVDAHSVVYHAAEFTEEELLRMNNMWRVKGYYGKREFYQPDEIDMQLPVPDARNTLLWAPSVVTDAKGEATVSFIAPTLIPVLLEWQRE